MFNSNPEPREEPAYQFLQFALEQIKTPELKEQCEAFLERYLSDLREGDIPDYPIPKIFLKRKLGEPLGDIGTSLLGSHLIGIQQSFGMYAYIYDQLAENIALALEESFGRSGKYLEIMAGTGWLAEAIAQYGLEGKYVATDLEPYQPIYPVKQMSAKEAIRRYKNPDCYILSWPFYGNEDAADAVRNIPSGKPILYMGEWGGNCGTPSLFEQLEIADSYPPLWERARDSYLTLFGLHDRLYLCTKV